MIKERYRAYPEYKDSGGVWLGNVPVHWSTSKIGYLSCKTGSGKTPKGGSEVYSDDGVLFLRSQNIYDFGLKIDKNDVVFISDNIDAEMSSSRVLAGDILLNITGASIGRTCIVPIDFQRANVNQHVCIIRVPLALQEYVALCLKSTVTKAQIDAAQNGAAREGLNFEQLSKIEIALPENKAEQEQIANFLDHETAKIDTLIEKQQQLIALLMEKRQAVISHAVTKGLNPDVPMKHSGVEWLGEVPAHWVVRRLKHTSKIQSGIPKGKDLTGKVNISVPMLRVANVQDGYLVLDDVHQLEIEPDQLERYCLEYGDVLMNEGGDNDKLGRGAVWKSDIAPCIHQNHVFAIRPFSIEPEWLDLLTRSDYAKFHFYRVAKQSTNLASISSTNIKETPLTIPPKKERHEIMEYVFKKLKAFDVTENKCNGQIQLLSERRTALISAAVTGKIDVRNWQPPTTPQNSPENQ